MGEWYNVMILRKYHIARVKVGESFDIEKLSGMTFNRPQLFTSYIHLIARYMEWDARLELRGEYPVYTFDYATESVDKESIVQVLIVEGDYSEVE